MSNSKTSSSDSGASSPTAGESPSRLHTDICDTLGIRHPLLLAGMGGVSGGELAAAVSEAGGLGVLGAALWSPDHMRAEIRKVRELTDKPFAVDLLAPDPERIRDHMKVIYEEDVRIFVAGLAVPEAFIEEMHGRDMLVMVMTGKVRHAEKAAAAGADMVVAQGTEAGGHTGEIGGIALVPQVVDAVDIPVLAAGGISDGRGVVAAMALGASGVVVGTRFIATPEAAAAECYRDSLLGYGSADTIRTRCYTGKPARALRNGYTDSWEVRRDDVQPFPLQAMHSAQEGVLDYTGRLGGESSDRLFMPAGQGVGSIHSIRPAGEVFEALVAEAEAILATPFFSR